MPLKTPKNGLCFSRGLGEVSLLWERTAACTVKKDKNIKSGLIKGQGKRVGE